MCGGEGSRLDAETEKPLYPIAGEPMVDRVRRALAESSLDRIYAVVSPNAPETRRHLRAADCRTIRTSGEGYVADLATALVDDRIAPPVVSVAADLPLLSAGIVDEICREYREQTDTATDDGRGAPLATDSPNCPAAPSMTVCVPRSLKRRLGVSVDESPVGADDLVPTGLNVVGADPAHAPDGIESDGSAAATEPRVHVATDRGLAINVNRVDDARIAQHFIANQ
nr:NTP transferase domain-containing protein [Halovivax limisalsi]